MLLFIAGSRYLSAGNIRQHDGTSDQSNTLKFDEFYLEKFSDDTIKTESSNPNKIVVKNDSAIPNPLSGVIFNFHVNSDINYLSFKHFRKDESKKMFSEALLKEKELIRISSQTDSLRKVYANSPNEQKEEIAVLILKNEELSMVLNSEIPVLYQSVRDQEDQYWQSAPIDEKVRFQEKIRLFRDSLTNEKLLNESKQSELVALDTAQLIKEPSKVSDKKPETTLAAIVYKIQIGAFKGKIPDATNKMIKKLSILRKVENFTDEKGMKVFSTGNLKTYQEAVTLQNQVKQEGVKKPEIVAFLKGKKINVDEARKLNHEL